MNEDDAPEGEGEGDAAPLDSQGTQEGAYAGTPARAARDPSHLLHMQHAVVTVLQPAHSPIASAPDAGGDGGIEGGEAGGYGDAQVQSDSRQGCPTAKLACQVRRPAASVHAA